MPQSDAEFIFSANINSVVREVEQGVDRLQQIASRQSKGVGGLLNQQTSGVTDLIDKRVQQLEKATNKLGNRFLSQGPGGNTGNDLAQAADKAAQRFQASMVRAYSNALNAAPKQAIPALQEYFQEAARTGFAAIANTYQSARTSLRNSGATDDYTGRGPGITKTANATAQVISEGKLGVARFDAEQVQQANANNAKINAASAQSAQQAVKQATALTNAAHSAEELEKIQKQNYEAAVELQAKINARDGSAYILPSNRNLAAVRRDDGSLSYRNVQTNDEVQNPGKIRAIEQGENELAKREYDARERRVAALQSEAIKENEFRDKLVAARDLQAQQLLIENAISKDVYKEVRAAGGRYAVSPTTGSVLNANAPNERVDDVTASRVNRAYEAQAQAAERRAAQQQKAADRDQQQVDKENALNLERLRGMQLGLRQQNKDATVKPIGATGYYDSTQDKYFVRTQAGQGAREANILEQVRLSQQLKDAEKKELETQERINRALIEKGERANSGGLVGGFLGGFTSAGFGGGSFSGSFDGLARTAGISAKYAATSAALYGMLNALQQVGAEYLNFEDSQTEFEVALGSGEKASGDFINSLEDLASVAGANVGDAMDVAASGLRAFKEQVENTKEAQEALGVSFEKQAARIAVISKQDIKTSGDQLKAASLAYQLTPDDAGFSQVTDALTGGKRLGGGDETEIAKGIAAGGVAAKQAGVDMNTLAILISKVNAQTAQSGTAIGQSFGRAFSIIGGTEGRNAIESLNSQLTRSQKALLAGVKIDPNKAPTKSEQAAIAGGKIDTGAQVIDQLRQVSKIYDSLSTQQQGALGNSLFGTANIRQGTILLQTLKDVDGTQIAAGEGAKDYNRRLQDITKTIQAIQGDLRNIAVNFSESGALAGIAVLIRGLKLALDVTRVLSSQFNKIPGTVREIAGVALSLLGVMKLIGAVSRAGGVGAFFAGAEARVAPGRALARNALAQGAAASGAAANLATTTVSGPIEARLAAAAKQVETGAQKLTSVLLDEAKNTQAAGDRVIQAYAAEGEARNQGITALRAATAEREAAEQANTDAILLSTRREAEARGALTTAVSTMQAEQLKAATAQRALTPIQAQADRAIAQAHAREAAQREIIARDLQNGVITEAGARTAIVDAELATAAAIEAANLKIATAVMNPLNKATGLQRELSFRGAATAISDGARSVRVAFAEAADLVRHGATEEAAAAAAGGGIAARAGAAFGAGGRMGLGGFAANGIGNGLTKGLGLVGGPIGGALIAGFVAIQATEANKAINEAIESSRARVNKLIDPADVDALKEASSNLAAGASELRESSKGLIASTVDFYKGSPVEKQAAQEEQAGARRMAEANALAKLQEAARTSANRGDRASTIDFTDKDSVAKSLQALSDAGASSADKATALADAIDRLGESADGAKGKLTAYDKQVLVYNTSDTALKSLRDDSTTFAHEGTLDKIADGKGWLSSLLRAPGRLPLGFGASIGWAGKGNKNTISPDDAKALQNLDYQGLGDAMDQAQAKYLSDGGSIDTADGQKKLRDILAAVMGRFLDEANFTKDPKKRAFIIDGAINLAAASTQHEAGALTGQDNASDTAYNKALAALPSVVGEAQDRGTAVRERRDLNATPLSKGMNKGFYGGADLAAAQATLSYLKDQRDDLHQAGLTDQELSGLDEQIDVVTKQVSDARASRVQTLAGYKAHQKYAPTQAKELLQSQIDGVLSALKGATGDTRDQLNDQLNQLLPQLSAMQPGIDNASAIGGKYNSAGRRGKGSIKGGIDPRDTIAVAEQATKYAKQTLDQIADSGDQTSADYFNAVEAWKEARLAESKTRVDEANKMRSAQVGVGDALGTAQANYKNAQATLDTMLHFNKDGSVNSDYAAQQAVVRQSKVDRDQQRAKQRDAIRLQNIDSRDTEGLDREQTRYLRDQLRHTPTSDVQGRADLRRQIAANLLKSRQDRADRIDSANVAATDPRDAVAMAATELRNARRGLALQIPGTKGFYDALADVTSREQAVAKAKVDRANAAEAASVFPTSQLQAAKSGLDQARRNLALDLAGTTEFYNDLAALHSAEHGYSQALIQAAHDATEATIDISDPVAEALLALQTAQQTLNSDIRARAPKDVLDPERVAVTQASNALEAAQFDARLNTWDTAERLGRITHAAHMRYLQGEHDRLAAITNRTYQQQQELDQVDLALKDATDNINSAMSGQFNLGDIKVPTVYEVRRSLGVLNGSAAGGSVDNSTNNTTVYINGTDFSKVVDYINTYLGGQAQITRSNGGRKT